MSWEVQINGHKQNAKPSNRSIQRSPRSTRRGVLNFLKRVGHFLRENTSSKPMKRNAESLADEHCMLQQNAFDIETLKSHSILGMGTFGTVRLVSQKIKDETTERCYAQKCMLKSAIVKRKHQKRVLTERNALMAMDGCPFIIKLLGTHQDEHSIYFLTEFAQGGTLQRYIKREGILMEGSCQMFTANLVLGLLHVHKMGYIHRDLKPSNCLLSNDGHLKICDFGMAKRVPSTTAKVVGLAFTMCGTSGYMAPEIVLSKKGNVGYGKGVDWWALGCIVVEMYTGRLPFPFDQSEKVHEEVAKIGLGTPKEGNFYGEEASSFVAALLQKESTRLGRENGFDVINHELLSTINIPYVQSKKLEVPYIPKVSHATDTRHFRRISEKANETQAPFRGDTRWCRHF